MNFREYQSLAMRTAKDFPTDVENLVHASLGLASEVGEFVSEVKRMAIYNKEAAPEMVSHMVEEIGDILWYAALAASSLHYSLGNIATLNIEKLQSRYPDAYSDAAAEARVDKGGLPHTES